MWWNWSPVSQGARLKWKSLSSHLLRKLCDFIKWLLLYRLLTFQMESPFHVTPVTELAPESSCELAECR